ncbi:MAG: LacI family DNA-binding transcriptional regulator [Pseudomonadota bacterium]
MKKAPGSSIHEVAREAGVSAATVSRFLNGTAKVSEDKRKIIESVIERLNYKPNVLAQSLKMGTSRTIGVLTQSLVSGYFNEAMTGIDDAMKAAGYAPLIMSGHWHADEEAERVELLIARRVDGLVILTGNMTDAQILKFSQRVPIVAFGRKLEGKHAFGFCLDNYSAACDAVEYLIEQGHRRIAFIAGPPDQEDARARLAGYRDTLKKHKIPVEAGLIVPGDFQESGGVLAVNQLLEAGQRFTAIFAGNDLTAYGARLGLYRRSIRVPEDISIVGFDDLHSSMCTTPPLTTVRQPLFDVGTCIGQIMLKMINHEKFTVDVPPLSLVVRESVRRLG